MKKIDLNLLKKLCDFSGISGDEKTVRDFIIKEIQDYATDYRVDPLGNLIVFKKGKFEAKTKLVVSAHMDEIGFIVTHISEKGFLKFTNVGGINSLAVPAQRVAIGEKNIPGVIGLKAKHLQTPSELSENVEIDSLRIDIGAKDRSEAEKYVKIGDAVVFQNMFKGNDDNEEKYGVVKSKALDDRAGCALLIELIKSELKYDTYFSFVVQEEVGIRGSHVAAYAINADKALILDVTTASDVPGVAEENQVTCLHQGPAISFMDKHTVYDREYIKLAKETAEGLSIKCQYKRAAVGGNDAGSFHLSRCGAKCISLSMIARYIHGALAIAATEDLNSWATLAYELINVMHEHD